MGSKGLTDLFLDSIVSNALERSSLDNIHFREDVVSCIMQSHILGSS